MINDGAIEIIKNERKCVTRQNGPGCSHNCEKCDLLRSDRAILAAYDLAIKALKSKSEAEEYRTPKDVIKRTDKGTDGKPLNIYECPTCKRVIASREGWVYCRFCGQALRWPREEK